MSIYPCRQDLRPVDHTQDPNIVPTQLIGHVAVAKVAGSGPGYHDGLDWHFYIAYGPGPPEQIVTQLRDTHIQADANFHANGPRADGSGAISFESEGTGDEPWTDDQVEAIIWLGHQANLIDGIPLTLCTTDSTPGVGYHRLFDEWNRPYHSCPGDLKVIQFRDVILPRLQLVSHQPSEDDMTPAQSIDVKGVKWFFVVGDDKSLFAWRADDQNWRPVTDSDGKRIGPFTSGLTAERNNDDSLTVAGRGKDGNLVQVVIYPRSPGKAPFVQSLGGHIFPAA